MKLKFQYFGYLMRRADIYDKTLMLGKIEGRRKEGWQWMRWFNSIPQTQWTWVWENSRRQGRLACCSQWSCIVGNNNDRTTKESPLWEKKEQYTTPWFLCSGSPSRTVVSNFSSIAQLCLTLRDTMDCSTPAFPVHHQLQVWACSNSCPSSCWWHPTIIFSVIPFSSCLQSFPASGSFPSSQFFTSGGQSVGVSISTSVHPMNI